MPTWENGMRLDIVSGHVVTGDGRSESGERQVATLHTPKNIASRRNGRQPTRSGSGFDSRVGGEGDHRW